VAVPVAAHRGARPHAAQTKVTIDITATVIIAMMVFVLGVLVGYLLRRPPRRTSSIQLGVDGAIQRGHGRHRR
jgi:hypothetical protein